MQSALASRTHSSSVIIDSDMVQFLIPYWPVAAFALLSFGIAFACGKWLDDGVDDDNDHP